MSIKKIFEHGKEERAGIAILLIVLVIAASLRWFLPSFFTQKDPSFTEFEAEVSTFETNRGGTTSDDAATPNFDKKENNTTTNVVASFSFDPNTASKEDFERLGLSERVANIIINYREKGGRFKKPEDFKKIYGLKDDDYERLKPYISLPETGQQGEASQNNTSKRDEKYSAPTSRLVSPKNFPFDPNTATREQFIELGLPEKVIGTLLAYRAKGGSFRYKEDMQKIFGMTEADYERLKPFIQLPNKPVHLATNAATSVTNPPQKTNKPISINQATAEDLQTIRGIGVGYSNKIIAFREKLGGFYSIAQVGETFGFPDSVFQKVKPFLLLGDVKTLRQIDINQAPAEEFSKHPYLDWKHANAIVNYRKQHGNFKHLDELTKLQIFTPELLAKVKPYFKVSSE